MAQIDDGRGSKSVNVDLNIVPFIDLMSVCISFLIISAVWTQVSMIQIGSSIYAKKTTDDTPKPPPRADVPFRLDIKPVGYVVVAGSARTVIPMKNGVLDTVALMAQLAKVKTAYPDKTDCVVTVADEMPYESLITGMDSLLKSGFAEISVATEEVE
jgi:biopolymer transport protein ExbD